MGSDSKLPSETERKLIHVSNSSASMEYGCSPYMRLIDEHINRGVINLLKPKGPTSHEVTAWVKDILHLKKAGHSGSLDPGVDGLLPTMLGKATKTIRALRLSGKEYVCLMRLHSAVPDRKIIRVCSEFEGQIFQIPPLISAVKRAVRIRKIYYLEIIEIKDNLVLMRIGCEAGTYIRKLCHDIGEALGCGAHMQELRRTKTGPFNEDTAVTLHDVTDAYAFWEEHGDESELRRVILPMEEGLKHLPPIVIRDSAVDAICHGASLAVPGIVSLDSMIKKDDTVCIYTLKGEAVALSRAVMDTDEILENDSGIVAVTERVIMDAGTYPSIWSKTD